MTLTAVERRSFQRWWLTKSGLTPAEVMEIALGLTYDPRSSQAFHERGRKRLRRAS